MGPVERISLIVIHELTHTQAKPVASAKVPSMLARMGGSKERRTVPSLSARYGGEAQRCEQVALEEAGNTPGSWMERSKPS
jgi:hypothetical protein